MAIVKLNPDTGNFEVFDNGQRVSTAGSKEQADLIAKSLTPQVPTEGRLPGSRVEDQGKPGFDVFGNPVEQPKKTAANGFGTGINVATLEREKFEASQDQPSPEEIRRASIDRFQGEIDTVDELFSGLILEARGRGAARLKESLGQTRSISAQRGTLGTLRGFGKRREVTEFEEGKTQAEIDRFEAERARQKSIIMTQIRDHVDNKQEAADAAKVAGEASFKQFLETEEAENFETANTVIAGLLSQGLTFEELDDDEITEVADGLGITVVELEAVYRGKLAEVVAEENKLVQDILKDAIKAGADVTTQQAIVDAASIEDALLASGAFVSDITKQKVLSEKALTSQRLASAAKSRADAAKTIAETKAKEDEPDPTSFTSTSGNEVEDQSSKEITTTLSKVVGQKIAFLIDSELNNEEKRLFLLDYRDTQEGAAQTIDPEIFFEEWKKTVNFEEIRADEEEDSAAKLQLILEALPKG